MKNISEELRSPAARMTYELLQMGDMYRVTVGREYTKLRNSYHRVSVNGKLVPFKSMFP